MLGTAVLGNLGMTRAAAASNGSAGQLLGGFEDGLDDWKTNGGNDLARISESDLQPAVTQGSYALDVTVSGDAFPMIERTSGIRDFDFSAYPYLIGDVVATPLEDSAYFSFQWKLHYDSSGGTGTGTNSTGKRQNSSNQGGSGNRGRPVNVETSPEIRVRPLSRAHIYWDLTDVETRKLESAMKLQLVWHPSAVDPAGGPRGRNNDGDYTGRVIFDNIRGTDKPSEYSIRKLDQLIHRLQMQHGIIQDAVTETSKPDYRAGYIEFSDGTQIEFTHTVEGDAKFKLVFGGTEYKYGGGWA